MGANITTIVYLRVLIIQIGSTIILMVVEAQGIYYILYIYPLPAGTFEKMMIFRQKKTVWWDMFPNRSLDFVNFLVACNPKIRWMDFCQTPRQPICAEWDWNIYLRLP